MICKYLVLLLLVLLQEVYLVSNKYTLMDQLSRRSDVAIKELTTHEYSSFERMTHTLMTFIAERPTVFNIEKNSTLPPINVSPSPESQIVFSQKSNNNQQNTQLPVVMDSKEYSSQLPTVVEYNDYFTQQDLKESRSSSYIHHVRSTILKEYGNERICFTNIFGHYVFNLPSMYYAGSKCIFITSL